MKVDYESLVQGRTKGQAGPESKEFPALLVKSIDADKRRIVALASAATLDRQDEIVLPTAFKELMPVYMKNPVVITNHAHRLQTGHSSVVGNVVDYKIAKEGLWVTIEFVKGTVLADEYWLLYSTKKQRAFSIGFVPKEWTYEEKDGQRIRVYTKIELIEISVCAVPANPDALSRSKQRKADFVAGKKEEREEQKILTELRAKDPDFDVKCSEFAEALLGLKSSGEAVDDFDFSELAAGKTTDGFAALVGS